MRLRNGAAYRLAATRRDVVLLGSIFSLTVCSNCDRSFAFAAPRALGAKAFFSCAIVAARFQTWQLICERESFQKHSYDNGHFNRSPSGIRTKRECGDSLRVPLVVPASQQTDLHSLVNSGGPGATQTLFLEVLRHKQPAECRWHACCYSNYSNNYCTAR